MASTSQLNGPNLAFTRAVFAFQGAGKKYHAVHTVEVPETSEDESKALALETVEKRHKRRIRIARGFQHLLTGLLSLAIALLQGAVYVKYQQTKNVKNAWPTHPNLLPTLMLFSTAIAGIAFDSAALIAYAWPQTEFGKKALALAVRANTMITTIKTTAYGFSTLVCKAGFNLGNSSGQYNDLWSWSCSAQGSAMNSTNNADFNCTGSTVAWYLSIAGIAIQFIGLVIDKFVAADAEKFAKATKDTEKGDGKGKEQSKASEGKVKKSKGDEDYDNLDKIIDDYDKQLKDQLPENKDPAGGT